MSLAIQLDGNYAQNIIETNLLTKFHEDRKINVASRVLTSKNAPPRGSHFHEDRTVNVASRENAPPLESHFFKANIIIFELIQDIIETNLLTKFHEDWTINVASRVLTRKNARPWWPYIIGTNLLTKFHDDQKINVTSRMLTRKIAPPLWWPYILGMNLLTEFHEDRTINVASREKCPAPWRPCYSSKHKSSDHISSRLEINVASRVLSRKNASPPGGHVFQPTSIIFELVLDIIGMNLLTNRAATI
ncbi:hypothetical protein DPMN_007739 [Dreissena polymorpha]|uniref:Uncharacterized protein n=1 Tax=Dreissena polymorpha TaxID=45954 RepID=A0A9D4RWA5_DREPO|nr:hypothetical protein DPMN_007739 [Dreissena polymorpha]